MDLKELLDDLDPKTISPVDMHILARRFLRRVRKLKFTPTGEFADPELQAGYETWLNTPEAKRLISMHEEHEKAYLAGLQENNEQSDLLPADATPGVL